MVRGHGATLEVVGTGVVLAGELDLATVEELTPGLFAALGAGSGDAVVDLRRVTYLASAGIGLLLETADRCRATDRRLRVLVDPSSAPARIVDLAGLGALVTAEEPAG
jgi:anti-anti-sigma factor